MRKVGCIVFLVLLLGGGVFVYFNYFFIYSEGSREGLLNKFSTKGTIFKTHEGELLMPGVVPTMNQLSNNFFYFSAQSPEIVNALEDATGKKVKVHYIQYRNSLPWRGDDYNDKNAEKGQYIVNTVEVVE